MRTLDSGKWVLKQFFFETFEELAESNYEDYPVYCSEVKEIIAEFRVFVLYGEIIDVRRYGGRN